MEMIVLLIVRGSRLSVWENVLAQLKLVDTTEVVVKTKEKHGAVPA